MADLSFDDLVPKGGGSDLDPRHRDLAVRTILGEAANEPDQGQVGVASVILNRLNSGKYGNSIPDVVLAKNQFEPWNTQGGRNRMFAYAPDSQPYQRASAALDEALAGKDPTNGATMFYSPKAQAAFGRRAPSWASGEPTVIGGHNFYGGKPLNLDAAQQPNQTASVASVERQPLPPMEGTEPTMQPQAKSISFDDLIPSPQPSTATDIAKSGGIGLAKGVIAAAGIPGDVGGLLNNYVVNPILRATGLQGGDKETPTLFGSGDIQKRIEGVTGEFYKPQTRPGRYAETVGEFVGNPISYAGPGGLTTKTATAITGGLGSEAAGQAAQGTMLEGPARIAGGVVGAIGGGARAIAAPAKAAPILEKAAVPTTENLVQTAKQGYQAAEKAGPEIAPEVMGTLANNITNSLKDIKSRDYLAPQTFRAIEELKQQGPSTIADIHGVRQLFGEIAQSSDKFERRAASHVIGEIDKFMKQAAPDAAKTLETANANYAAGMRSKQLETASEIAGLRAGRAGYGGNSVNTMRQVLSPIVEKSIKGNSKGFSKDEISAMRDIVEGTTLTNSLRTAGMASPSRGVIATGGGIGAMAVLGPAGALIPGLGAASNKLANILTSKQIDRLGEMVRKRSPMYADAVSKATEKYSTAAEAFAKEPAPNTFLPYVIASRSLAAGLKRDGIDVSSGDLLRNLQGPSMGRAEGDQQEVPRPPGQ